MRIKATRHGITHFYAQCSDCDFDAGILTKETYTKQDVRNEINKHIRKTGHTVELEKAVSTTYEPYK